MLNFTREQRGAAFDKLPKDVKQVVMSGALAETFQKIGAEHKLAIDKTGILADVVTLTILDLIPRDRLVAKISEELGISGNEAIVIAKSVNERVFLRIREILREEQSRETSEAEAPEEEEVPQNAAEYESRETTGLSSKADILAEIENPAPAIHPISNVDQTVPGPARPREIISEERRAATHDFIGNALAGNASSPAQKTVIELKKKEPEKPKSYPSDPYREPLA